MNDFTASNGGTVEKLGSGRVVVTDDTPFKYPDGTTRAGQSSYLDPGQIITLREFFQAEADERLGRWRWSENPDYVVYDLKKIGMEGVKVICERDGYQQSFTTRSQAAKRPGSLPAQAAVAYFDAHPELKSWYDAEPGEVWVFDIGDRINAVAASFVGGEWLGMATGLPMEITDAINARRIWPEVSA